MAASPDTPSLTAFVVAATVAKLGARPRWRGIAGEEALALAAAFVRHAPDTAAARLVARMPAPVLVGALEHAFVPGMAWHYLFRKHWIENEARRAVAGGARQLLVVGAGFDTLSVRLARAFPALRAVEIDRPSTQARKRDVLARSAFFVPPNCAFVPADLAERPLDGVAAESDALRPDLPTVVVIEGVLMYLEEAAVQGLFAALHRFFRAPTTLLFGATAAPDAAGDWRLRLADRLLAGRGEGTSWCCPLAEMPAFLAPLGFAVEAAVAYRELQRRHRSDGEVRRIPADDENYYRAVRVG